MDIGDSVELVEKYRRAFLAPKTRLEEEDEGSGASGTSEEHEASDASESYSSPVKKAPRKKSPPPQPRQGGNKEVSKAAKKSLPRQPTKEELEAIRRKEEEEEALLKGRDEAVIADISFFKDVGTTRYDCLPIGPFSEMYSSVVKNYDAINKRNFYIGDNRDSIDYNIITETSGLLGVAPLDLMVMLQRDIHSISEDNVGFGFEEVLHRDCSRVDGKAWIWMAHYGDTLAGVGARRLYVADWKKPERYTTRNLLGADTRRQIDEFGCTIVRKFVVDDIDYRYESKERILQDFALYPGLHKIDKCYHQKAHCDLNPKHWGLVIHMPLMLEGSVFQVWPRGGFFRCASGKGRYCDGEYIHVPLGAFVGMTSPMITAGTYGHPGNWRFVLVIVKREHVKEFGRSPFWMQQDVELSEKLHCCEHEAIYDGWEGCLAHQAAHSDTFTDSFLRALKLYAYPYCDRKKWCQNFGHPEEEAIVLNYKPDWTDSEDEN